MKNINEVASTISASAWTTVKPAVPVVKQYKFTLSGVVVTGVAYVVVGPIAAVPAGVATVGAFCYENKTTNKWITGMLDKSIAAMLDAKARLEHSVTVAETL